MLILIYCVDKYINLQGEHNLFKFIIRWKNLTRFFFVSDGFNEYNNTVGDLRNDPKLRRTIIMHGNNLKSRTHGITKVNMKSYLFSSRLTEFEKRQLCLWASSRRYNT